jgi:hypothetical protein
VTGSDRPSAVIGERPVRSIQVRSNPLQVRQLFPTVGRQVVSMVMLPIDALLGMAADQVQAELSRASVFVRS